MLPPAWRTPQSQPSTRDLRWRFWLDLAWRGSEQGEVEPPLWLRRAALLSHLDAPAAYTLAQLRGRVPGG